MSVDTPYIYILFVNRSHSESSSLKVFSVSILCSSFLVVRLLITDCDLSIVHCCFSTICTDRSILVFSSCSVRNRRFCFASFSDVSFSRFLCKLFLVSIDFSRYPLNVFRSLSVFWVLRSNAQKYFFLSFGDVLYEKKHFKHLRGVSCEIKGLE